MRVSLCIGRVGGLAICLGIGVAAGIGITPAWGSPADPVAPNRDSPANSLSAGSDEPRSPIRGRGHGSGSATAINPATSPPQPLRGSARAAVPGLSQAPIKPVSGSRLEASPLTLAELATGDRVGALSVATASGITPGPSAVQFPAASVSLMPAISQQLPAPAVVAHPSVSNAGLDSVHTPIFGVNPESPVESPLSWTVLAVARRQAASKTTGAVSSATASAENANSIASLLFNETPTLSWSANPGQSMKGVVTGTLSAADSEGDPLLFAVTTAPSHGTVTIGSNGSYTYTPFESFAFDGTTDIFTVTANDAGAGFHLHGIGGLLNLLTFGLLGSSGHTATVAVPVSVTAWERRNSAPTGTVTVSSPDPVSGKVLGQVFGTDAEGDTLTYSAPTTTTKGSVAIDAVTGLFTYTPNTTARSNAAKADATASDKADTFSVIVSDGHGGIAAVPVDVVVSPAFVAVASIGGLNRPTNAAINGSGTRLYVSELPGIVAVVDTSTNSVANRIDLGQFVLQIAPTVDGNRAYVSQSDNTVAVIDTVSNRVSATIGGFQTPDSVVVSPDGKRLYVANLNGSSISVIDTSTNTISATVPVGTGPHGLALNATGTRAYVGSSDGKVYVIDTASNSVQTINTGPMACGVVAVSPDGSKAYVVHYAGTVSIIDTSTNGVVGTITGLTGPVEMAISPDGRFLVVTSPDYGTVSVISTATNSVTTSIAGFKQPFGVAFAPDGSRAYITDPTANAVTVINTA